MKSLSWQSLQKGDIVDLVAPGYAVSAEDVEKAKMFLLSWGLVPRCPPDLQAPHFLHSNSDEKRFQFLKNAIQAKDSKVIWSLRGGYGSNRLLPMLAKLKRPQNEKLFIGLSDVTSIHSYLNEKWGWSSLHGSLLDRLGNGKVPVTVQREMKKILFGEQDKVVFKKLKALNPLAQKTKRLQTSVTGGNLITFESLLATPFQPKANNSILFFEDIGERGYRIDRVLVHLQQAKVFKKCAGVVFGHFTLGDEPQGGNKINQVLQRFANEVELPVWKGLESGHDVLQRPLFFGTKAVMKKNENQFELSVEVNR